jgi:hypothetical protein
MRCSRLALSLLLAVLGGAVIALGSVNDQLGAGADPCPASPPDPSCCDTLGSTPTSEAKLAEEPDHFDNGDVASSADDAAPAAEDNPATQAQSNPPAEQYRYEYPEENYGYGYYGKTGKEALYAEQYYYKYGYQYANPEQKYGYTEPAAETTGETGATEEANKDQAGTQVNKDLADDETPEAEEGQHFGDASTEGKTEISDTGAVASEEDENDETGYD